jgi:hypothetical protein
MLAIRRRRREVVRVGQASINSSLTLFVNFLSFFLNVLGRPVSLDWRFPRQTWSLLDEKKIRLVSFFGVYLVKRRCS